MEIATRQSPRVLVLDCAVLPDRESDFFAKRIPICNVSKAENVFCGFCSLIKILQIVGSHTGMIVAENEESWFSVKSRSQERRFFVKDLSVSSLSFELNVNSFAASDGSGLEGSREILIFVIDAAA